MGAHSPAILARGVVKRFGTTHALAGLDLTAEPGTILGVLGPNGAGKTTAVRILTTLLRPDAGHAQVAGFDVVRQPDQVRSRSVWPVRTPPSTSSSPVARTSS